MKHRLLACLLTVCLLLGLCACGSDLREETTYDYTLGVVLKTMDAEHWKELRSGMEHAANERNVRLILQYPSNELAAGEQELILRDMAGQDIDALLFAPCDSNSGAWLTELAAGQELPLFTVDTPSANVNLPYIGSDNREIGRMAYEYLLDALAPGSKVGIIMGTSSQMSLSERATGFRFYCVRDGLLTVTQTADNCNSYIGAYQAALEMIRTQKVSAIFCTSGVLGLGAVSAKEETGRDDVRIVAVDTQQDALNAVQTGRLDALISQSGYDIGYLSVIEACDYLSGKPVREYNYITNELLTIDNIDAFLDARQDSAAGR